MAALDFPASPELNTLYTANGKSFKWDGTVWRPVGAALADDSVSAAKLLTTSDGSDDQVLTRTATGMDWEDAGGGGWTHGATRSTTSGSSASWTDIPAGVNQVKFIYENVSNLFSGGSPRDFNMQVGTSSAYATSGYTNTSVYQRQSYIFSDTEGTSQFRAPAQFWGLNASRQWDHTATFTGVSTLTRGQGNDWMFETNGRNNFGWTLTGTGFVSLSGELRRAKIDPSSTTFDSGNITIMYQ